MVGKAQRSREGTELARPRMEEVVARMVQELPEHKGCGVNARAFVRCWTLMCVQGRESRRSTLHLSLQLGPRFL